jgi:hypothetical protein
MLGHKMTSDKYITKPPLSADLGLEQKKKIALTKTKYEE